MRLTAPRPRRSRRSSGRSRSTAGTSSRTTRTRSGASSTGASSPPDDRIAALERLAAIHAGQQNRERAIELLGRAARLAPYREDLLISLLEQLVAMGRTGEARARCDDFRRMLVRELGVEPSPTLDAFWGRTVESPSRAVPRR
ncbi:MAG: hypothetical protein IPK07_20390 [Deltaproteobacteria bacterium]|nr:hypothetical protein [Deltaproteobacteria bacterium]